MSHDLSSGRRRFLQRGAVLGAAAAGAATAARAEPLTVAPWTRTPGEPVLWHAYGQPSPFEKDVVRRSRLLPADAVLDARTLPQVKMPNRDGFVADARPDTANVPCRSGCPGKP